MSNSTTWKALARFGRIPPEAWDWIVPHGPIGWRAVADVRHIGIDADAVALNPQPLPPHESVVGAQLVENLLVGAIIVVGGREGGGKAFLDDIDDWCGTGWPRRWPKPKPRGEWDDGLVFAGAAVAAATLAEQYEHNPELQEVLGQAAERLAAQVG